MHHDGFVSRSAETIVYFPLGHRRHLVRATARRLDQLNGDAATDFWKSLCGRLKAELFAAGRSYEDTRHEILAFQAAVHQELLLLYEPDGAARGAIAT
ncbi:MAG: DUF6074 family protein [Rhizobium sp.]|nr:DUF6074 family protein [Rhizobium sp.]